MIVSRNRENLEVIFTTHAEDKFIILQQHGFVVTRQQVIDTVLKPDGVFPTAKERLIAQKGISTHHVLRVVYREEENKLFVITFYPGRRRDYEGSV